MSQKNRIGAFFSIQLRDGRIAYARLLKDYLFSFYFLDNIQKNREELIDCLRNAAPIFSTYVYARVFKDSNWKYIGQADLEPHILQNMPVFFRQDQFDKTICILITSTDPNFKAPLKPEQCINMERAMIWEPESIDERICNYLDGAPNKFVELARVKL